METKTLSERFFDRHNSKYPTGSVMTPIDQLDFILEFIDVCYTPETIWIDSIRMHDTLEFMGQNTNIGPLEVGIIINKLVKDEYIEHRSYEIDNPVLPEIKMTVNEYRIAFEGKLFLQNGGYKREQEIIDAKLRQDVRTNNVLRVAGYATILWFVLEVWKFYTEFPQAFDFLKCGK